MAQFVVDPGLHTVTVTYGMFAAPSEKPESGPVSTTISVVFGPVGVSTETTLPVVVVTVELPPPQPTSAISSSATQG
ncbi:hypothetical protein [Piscinibacter sp.]|uniref:hypothetical protein n=1 Tax=Piscinibacter sp. TaxID=1903157 RepID=UPI003559ECEB